MLPNIGPTELIIVLCLTCLPVIVVIALAGGLIRMRSQRSKTSDYRACPHCAEPIRAEAKVCRYCGRDVHPMMADTAGSETSADVPNSE